MIYKVNDEGVRALREAQASIMGGVDAIREASKKVKSNIAGYDNAGPHHDEIIDILEDIDRTIQNASEPCAEVAIQLGNLAEKYQAIIDKRIAGS